MPLMVNFFTYPIVVSFNLIAKLLARGKKADRITEDDIRFALEAGAQAGVIEEAEQDMVENIFRLGDRRVGVLMQPRVDIHWLDSNDDTEKIRETIIESNHYRFPVCEGDIDRVIGVVHARDILIHALSGAPINLKEIAVPPLFVNENLHIFELMDILKSNHNTMALVTDEYGTIQGMITVDDIMSAIVKEVDLESEEHGAQFVKVSPRSWLIDGKIPIDEFKEMFHFESLPEEERARYRTLSGLCMNQLAAVPKKGDAFIIDSCRFEIISVRKNRVEKVLLTRLA